MLLAEHHLPPSRHACARAPVRQRGPLGLGALGQRRDAADGVVAGGEVGELLGGRRTTSADVGVVRLDLGGRAGRAVGHHDQAERAVADGHWRAPRSSVRWRRGRVGPSQRPSACTSSTTRSSTAGVGLGQHAVAEVEHVAGMAGVAGRARRAWPRPPTSHGAKHERRVEVALQGDPVGRTRRAGDVEGHAPVDADDVGAGSAPSGRAAPRCRRRSGCGARRGRPRPSNTRLAVGEHEALVVGRAQRPGPGVEELQGRRRRLATWERSEAMARSARRSIERVPHAGVAVHQRLGPRRRCGTGVPRSGSWPR